jgi:hypothetical protein
METTPKPAPDEPQPEPDPQPDEERTERVERPNGDDDGEQSQEG